MDNNTDIHQTVSHIFRRESGKMVAVLVKIFGSENLEIAEDVVQDALINALETWKFKGLPDNPRAWLYRVAKNKAIDIIRRNKHSQTFDFSDPERQLLNSEYTLAATMDNYWQDSRIKDDFLGMMFACCHKEISQENQITFILKSLCGFSTKEVAKAFLTTEETISKRIYRTKEYFRKHKTRPTIPRQEDIGPETNAVLSTIYLMFNEGYNSTHSDEHIREDLISQAMLLCKSLLEYQKTQLPEVYALLALMCFHASRTNSRMTSEGELILIKEQDRSSWNKELIQMGNQYLNQSAFNDKLTNYHLEAAIAYEHCTAKNQESTNWKAIQSYYDIMLSLNYDPVVALNRCLITLEISGPKKAFSELENIKSPKQLQKYYLYHAIKGEIYLRLEQKVKAADCFEQALSLTLSVHEKRFLRNKIAAINN